MNFQTESWRKIREEILPLTVQHWREMGLSGQELSLDEEKYSRMDADGSLLVVTARSDGKLVGYFLNFLCRHPHYEVLTAAMDVYFMLPEHRTGTNGSRLFQATENACREKGVGLMLATARMDRVNGASRIFGKMGWQATRQVFEKRMVEHG